MVITTCRLSRVALGLAFGILWGLVVLIVGLIAHFADYGTPFVNSMGVLYIGYGPSILGSIIGGVVGFIDAFIGGFLLAWIYNLFANRAGKKVEQKTTTRKPKPAAPTKADLTK
jgi:uncharacterized membrane protein YdjX (TVP38/TMEM64 family)